MDLKSLREDKLKYTREEFSKMLGVSPEQLDIWEATGKIDLDIIQKIATVTGLDFNTVLGYKKESARPVEPDDTWKDVDFTQKSIQEYIKQCLEKLSLDEEHKKNYVDDLQNGIEKITVKPKIAIVGRSDTGKSTLINAMIGMEKMPTSWTPTTAIAVYIKHTDDKPDFINADEDTWIFADSKNGEEMWDEQRLGDKEYCNKWKIASGNIDILQSFGIRQGDNHNNAGSAIVFVDAPILKNCDIIDLPGYGTETEKDDVITKNVTPNANILIYLSQANGFMRNEDNVFLKNNIKMLPAYEKKNENNIAPLSNLFIVASQAHTINNGNDNDLSTILKSGFERFSSCLSDDYWNDRSNISGYSKADYSNYLADRFFTYTTDIPRLCEKFNSDLKKILELLPPIITVKTKDFVREYVTARKPNLDAEIKTYEDLLVERENYVKLLAEIDANKLEREEENNERKQKIHEKIEDLCEESLSEFRDFYSSHINSGAIAEQLKTKRIKNKTETIESFAISLQDSIQEKANSILQRNGSVISKATEKYITDYSNDINATFEESSLSVSFDSKWAFGNALAKSTVLGGLGTFAVGLVGGMVTLGLGAAGTASIIATLLGPVGIVLGLLTGIGMGIAKLFGKSWQKSVAGKIVNSFYDNNVLKEYERAIKQYWDETKEAFDSAAEGLACEWKKHVEGLRKNVESYDVTQIYNNIAILNNLKSFFENIPL